MQFYDLYSKYNHPGSRPRGGANLEASPLAKAETWDCPPVDPPPTGNPPVGPRSKRFVDQVADQDRDRGGLIPVMHF